VSIKRHKRQILLFLLAILAPAGVLVGLAGRIYYQDRELSAKRAADQRKAAVDQLRRELTARLEAIKLQEINRLLSGGGDSGSPAVILTAKLEDGRMVLPWETPAPVESPEFGRRRQEGLNQEFVKKDNAAAAAAYRSALEAARTPSERAEGRLLLARTTLKAGNADEAARLYTTLLNDSSSPRTEEGVRYRFYAAKGLLDAKRDTAAVTSLLLNEADGENRLTLPELYMLRDLLGASSPARLSDRISAMQQAAALSKDVPRIQAQIDAGAAWVPYGEEPWLVTIAAPQPPLPGVVVILSSAKAAPPGVRLRDHGQQGDPLGETFPGLRAEWSSDRFLDVGRQGLPAAVWVAGLALVLGIAVFGGYLLLRDVNRDVRVAEVRAQFVASVSHELKTPLTAIRMFAETLAMGRSRDETTRSEYLETIVNESERLARLVDNVLDFSKIEQGKKIYRLRPTRLEEVAGSAIRAMQFPLAQQGFQLHYSVQGDVPELPADPDAIQQAILNLLTNAMKYSGDAREIDLRLAARNGDAVIEVQDRGLGLAPEEQKHVFEKFYRAPSHAGRLIAGTGLGLTLVAHIAKAHGGRVQVESSPGAGSTFSIFIPIAAHNGNHA
jgi:signal transduction histidine kinase